jgi:hypothetical protein
MRGRADARTRRFAAKKSYAFPFAIFASSRFNLH